MPIKSKFVSLPLEEIPKFDPDGSGHSPKSPRGSRALIVMDGSRYIDRIEVDTGDGSGIE